MNFTTLTYVEYANGHDEHVQCGIVAEGVEQAKELTVKELAAIAQRYGTHIIHMAPVSVFVDEEPFGHTNN